MAILKTLRQTDTCPPSGLHPYIDTPDFSYDQWLWYLHNNGLPIGSASGSPSVAVIGAGVSGLCAAYELMRAGCTVTVFEQASDVGGRCASHLFSTGGTDIAEMGSMRFPPTEFILDFYLKTSNIVPNGLCSLPDFPDPGVVSTYVCYGNIAPFPWSKSSSSAPAGFETVYKGWVALMQNGLSTDLPGAGTITAALASGDINGATSYWQNYLDVFGQQTFYSALYAIFTGASGYPIPNGTAWTFDDFDRFGALGLGSGGFGPLYPISFMDIFRLIVNELETTQKFLQPSSTLTNGIRTLAIEFGVTLQNNGRPIQTSTPVSSIEPGAGGFVLNGQYGPFDRIIVATTTRAMELTLGLTNYVYGPGALISPAVARAIMRTHVVSSNKVAARISNFWANDPSAVRCLQTDDLVHQVYTLDYTPVGASSPDSTGVCFISYVWDDDAVKQQALTGGVPTGPADNQQLYQYLLNRLAAMGDPVATWTNNLQPLNGDFQNNVVFEEWQSRPYFAGAFKLSQPGQDKYVQTMFFDQKSLTGGLPDDTGVYIAGDCVSWTSGWVEGALTTGLNAAAGVIQSLGGTLNPDASGRTPLTINANRYRYF
ncbi:MAG: Tryptophan 2-monooxygenase [Microvirga sp.]|jgi:tryptophan 2-monooxygenase|nr:Tryptophan 2-monooxygenase [Microvirga sp.]